MFKPKPSFDAVLTFC